MVEPLSIKKIVALNVASVDTLTSGIYDDEMNPGKCSSFSFV